ncbi:MAG: phosphate ABC transporter permease PtsA, partial [Mesorhizobium sp.]
MSTAASLHQSRKRRNGVMMTLCVVAAGIGLAWLALILGALLYKGLSGVSLAVFTEMTPPPGDAGGLLNAIYGSVVMTI